LGRVRPLAVLSRPGTGYLGGSRVGLRGPSTGPGSGRLDSRPSGPSRSSSATPNDSWMVRAGRFGSESRALWTRLSPSSRPGPHKPAIRGGTEREGRGWQEEGGGGQTMISCVRESDVADRVMNRAEATVPMRPGLSKPGVSSSSSVPGLTHDAVMCSLQYRPLAVERQVRSPSRSNRRW
jgi:hypothetical protein